MPDHTHTLTNGAAHVAIFCLNKGLSSIDDIFTGGSLSLKLKAAKRLPAPLPDEKQIAYDERIETWTCQPFGEVVMEESERDILKQAIKTVAEKKELPSNEYTVELISILGLNKKQP